MPIKRFDFSALTVHEYKQCAAVATLFITGTVTAAKRIHEQRVLNDGTQPIDGLPKVNRTCAKIHFIDSAASVHYRIPDAARCSAISQLGSGSSCISKRIPDASTNWQREVAELN